MSQIQNLNIKPLIESSKGLHLSSYISNSGHPLQLKKKVLESIEIAKNYLSPVLNDQEMSQFLAPMKKLSEDIALLKSFRGNLGIFRTEDSFRLLNIPVEVDNLCIVATSFHVKPLLRWLQFDQDFLLLGLEQGMASLYRGSMGRLRKLDSIIFPEMPEDSMGSSYSELKQRRRRKERLLETWDWIDVWLGETPKRHRPKLFIAGAPELSDDLLKRLKYFPKHPKPISYSFSRENTPEVAAKVRELLRHQATEALQKALTEYKWAEEEKRAHKNLFLIARAAVQGQVSKLIVADGVNIFGKICSDTGGLAIHPTGLDHEDDDILDDLAQRVLRDGGEVIVAPKEQIPYKRPALAILSKKRPRARLSQKVSVQEFTERTAI